MSMSVKDFFQTSFEGRAGSTGLLVLRVLAGLSLFMKHGLEKLTGYSKMVQHFPDPIHIGAHASLAFALFSDGICSILIVLGLATRLAALFITINLLTAFFLVHHAAFLSNGHVELVVVYIAVFAAILIIGPGRFSVDENIPSWFASRKAHGE